MIDKWTAIAFIGIAVAFAGAMAVMSVAQSCGG